MKDYRITELYSNPEGVIVQYGNKRKRWLEYNSIECRIIMSIIKHVYDYAGQYPVREYDGRRVGTATLWRPSAATPNECE